MALEGAMCIDLFSLWDCSNNFPLIWDQVCCSHGLLMTYYGDIFSRALFFFWQDSSVAQAQLLQMIEACDQN